MLWRAGLKSFPGTLCFNKIEIDCCQHVPVGALAAALGARAGGEVSAGWSFWLFLLCAAWHLLCVEGLVLLLTGPATSRAVRAQSLAASIGCGREGVSSLGLQSFHQDADHLVVGAFISHGLVMAVENGGQNRIHLGELHAEPLALGVCREPGGRQRGAGRQPSA